MEIKIYHVETRKDYDHLMIELEKQGYMWINGDELKAFPQYWNLHKGNTCIILNGWINGRLTRCSLERIKEFYPNINVIKHKAKGVEQMEKVVVPQFVADWFEKSKNAYILSILLDELQATEDEDIVNWRNNCEGRFVDNFANAEETIAKMYLFEDYEVEEEKKYYWRKKKEYAFGFEHQHSRNYLNLDGDNRLFFSDKSELSLCKTKFTETKVKQLVGEEDFDKLERVEI